MSRRLLLLVGAVLVPATLLGAGMVWMQYRTDRARAETGLVEQARGLARLVDAEFSRAEAAALALAASPTLARGDLLAFDAELRAARDRLSASRAGNEADKLAFFDAEGRRRVYTGWPDSELRLGATGLPYVGLAIATGQPAVSELIDDPASGPPCAAVAVPVFAARADGTRVVAGAVAVTVARERLLDVVRGAGLLPGALASVQDRNGLTVARTSRDAEMLGKLPAPAVFAAIKAADAGLAPRGTRTLEGVPSAIAFARAPSSGYAVTVGVPDAVLLAPLWSALLRAAVMSAAMLVGGLVLAWLVARRTVLAFRRVPGMAANAGAAGTTGLREADELATALAERAQADANARALFESSPVGVVISDTGGRVHAANDAFLRIVGRTRAELEAGTIRWDKITPEEWLAKDEAAITEAVAHGRCVPYEKEYVRPDGSRVPVLLSFGLTDRAMSLAAAFVTDLTPARDAEAARQASEEFAASVLDATSDCIVVLDAEGRVAFMNEPGRCQKEIDDLSAVIGRPVDSLWPEASAVLVRDAVARARAGEVVRYAAFGPTAKGTPKWWDVAVSPLPSRDGKPPRLLSVARDVTEARRTEQALRDSQAWLRLATEGAGLGTWELDYAVGRVTWAPETAALFGVERTEFTVEDWVEALHPDDRARAAEAWRQAVEDGAPYEVEYRAAAPAPDGGERWLLARGRVDCDASGSPVRDALGRPVRAAGVVLDVTARKRAEAALAASERRLALALDGTSDGLWDWDIRSGAVFSSPRMVGMLGYGVDEWEQTYDTWREHVHPDDLAGAEEAIRQHIAGGTGSYVTTFRMRHKDGRWLWILSRGRAYRDDTGVPVRMVGAHTDVTEQKEAERRDAFRIDLSERLNRAETPAEVMETAAAALGPHLGVAACGYAEADPAGEVVTVHHDWTAPGMPSYAGASYHLDDYGPDLAGLLRAGQPAVVADTQRDPLTAASAAAHAAIRSLAFLNVPVLRGGVPVGMLYCTADRPRDWTEAEVALVAEVAGRTRAALERARAEAELRASETRLRVATEGAGVGTWELDLRTGRGLWSPEAVALFGVDRADFTGADWAEAVHPDDRPRATEAWRRAVEEGAPYELEYRAAAPEGGERWLLARGRVERDASGTPVRGAGVLLDVTERRRTEAALAESEARLRLATAGSGIGTWELDLVTGQGRWSAEAAALLGRPHEEDTSDSWPEAVHPGDRAGAAEAFQRALEGRAGYDATWRAAVPMPDGGPRWVTSRAVLQRDAGGRALRALGVLIDVTAAKRAEAALAVSEARLRATIEATPVGIVFAEAPSGRLLYGNGAVERIFRHPMLFSQDADAYGEWESYHADGRRVAAEEYPLARTLRTGEAAQGEYHFAGADGVRRWIALTAAPIRDADGRVTGAVVVCNDVDEQRRAEAALSRLVAERETELARRDARLGSWFEHAVEHLFVVRVEADGRFVYDGLNPSLERATGLDSEALHGRTPAECFPESLAAELEANYRRAVEAGTPIHYEEEMTLPAGRKRLETSLVPVRDPYSGRIETLLGSSRDVTEQRRLQAREAQGQRLAALGQLAGGIAHDFNNVMQAVTGGAGLIRKRAADPDAVAHLARMIEDAAGRGASVTRRLLAFSRRDELRAEPVDAAALVGNLHEVFVHTLGSNIEVRVEAAPGLPPILADKGQLETVLVNLATNARDAMPRGGALTLSVEEECIEPGTVRAGLPELPAGRYIRLAVSDSGEGMTPDVLSRVTEPFFTTKERGKGTGLGLAMARGFAEQSGGTLAIRSMPGAGTTVTLWLRAADAGAGAAPMPDAAPAGRTQTRVLVVDDEAVVREVLAEALEEAGHTALRASDAAVALAMLEGGAAVDVLLTDLSMPGAMDGRALIAAARRLRPGLPAVLLTGNAGDLTEAGLALDGVVQGGIILMRKPVRAEQLTERIASLLERGTAAEQERG